MRVKVTLATRCTHYCGRASSYNPTLHGKDFSILGNPFYPKSEADRDKVCDQYEKYFFSKVESDPEFQKAVSQLISDSLVQTVKLGCFCFPRRCHCDTVANFINNRMYLEYNL